MNNCVKKQIYRIYSNEINAKFVCLFDKVNQSVTPTIGSGLQGPQGPFSISVRQIGTLFL